jgi:hypothetical protein
MAASGDTPVVDDTTVCGDCEGALLYPARLITGPAFVERGSALEALAEWDSATRAAAAVTAAAAVAAAEAAAAAAAAKSA